MSHVVREIGWAEIDIVRNEHRIFFQQRWQYKWQVDAGQSAWTIKEKRKFHAHVDKYIWASWSNRVKLKPSGKPEWERGGTWPMNLDVRWVLQDPHWTVEVTKVAAGTQGVGQVFWNDRRITLNTGDLNAYQACTDQTGADKVCSANFVSVPHEFGHAIGNTAVLDRGDEYRKDSPNLADTKSLLNIGKELRVRHFRSILEEMDKMVSGVSWSVDSIRN